jgi:carboxymethylenebutenolidase
MPAMCFDLDSRPPIPPIAGAAVDGARSTLRAADGTEFSAFSARPATPSGAAMLILPDVRGLHPFYEELALRFAEAGVEALAIDYFGRTASMAPRGEEFEYMPHVDACAWSTLQLDMQAGVDELRARPGVRGVFSVGFCFGGRLAFLSATLPDLSLTGAVGFYGPPQSGRNDLPAPVDRVRSDQAAVLGLFGGDDASIPDEAIAAFDRALAEAGVDHELVTYPGAPHSFFDRKAADYAAESEDAWRRIREFVLTRTPAG